MHEFHNLYRLPHYYRARIQLMSIQLPTHMLRPTTIPHNPFSPPTCLADAENLFRDEQTNQSAAHLSNGIHRGALAKCGKHKLVFRSSFVLERTLIAVQARNVNIYSERGLLPPNTFPSIVVIIYHHHHHQ